MQRPRRIRRHEFDDDALALVNVAATEAIAQSQHTRDDRATLDRRKSEVDESRTRDVDRRDDIAQRGGARSGNGFGELARILSRTFGEIQGVGRREIAVIGIAGPLERRGRVCKIGQFLANRAFQSLFDLLSRIDLHVTVHP